MRHLKRGRKLNRTPAHRRAMVRNLVTSLFVHGRVRTTPAKAKEARPFAEKLITLAKDGGLSARRRAISLLHDKGVVGSLFGEIGPRYANRPGGYCRILHLSGTRVGDSAPQCIFELVEEEMKAKTPRGKKAGEDGSAPSAVPTAEAEASVSEAKEPEVAPASAEEEKAAESDEVEDASSDSSEEEDAPEKES